MRKNFHRSAFLYILNALLLTAITFGQTNNFLNPAITSKIQFDEKGALKRNGDRSYELPKRGSEKLDWGLALSGGGIRSGSFSVGVLKALYDKEIGGERLFDQIDVISSVSGGGYASFWLISNYFSSGNHDKFGRKTFGDDIFVRNVCKLQSGSKFITKRNALAALFKSNPYSFEIYESRILSTFGNSWDNRTSGNKMTALKSSIDSAKMPYFIFNAALKKGELGSLGQMVEITPDYVGNPVLGYYDWNQAEEEQILRISEAAAISGAAVRAKWKRKLDNFSKEVIRRRTLSLSDGGFAENLAALPLIRRGIKNVIISDAEHDPGYKFGGYVILQNALAEMGINFCVDGIEACEQNTCKPVSTEKKKKLKYSKAAVSTGCAKADPKRYKGTLIESKIYYIKMSRPDSVYLSDKFDSGAYEGRVRNAVFDAGRKLIEERQDLIEKEDNYVNCENALNFPFKKDMYFFRVNDYTSYLSGRKLFKVTGKIFPKSLQYKFPQIPTVDQNYYADQLEAFVALGYLETSELNFSGTNQIQR